MMYNPPHPGALLREDVLKELGLSVEEAAERLGVSRSMLARVVKCKAKITPDLALRLELAGISTARALLAMQANYDLFQAKQLPVPHVRALTDAVAA